MPNAKLFQLIPLIIVAACTSQPNKVADAGPDVQCHSQQLTGSLITKSVCTTRDQRAHEQAQVDALKQEIQTSATASQPGGQH
jgi:uncharacterized lipoprotein YajG